MLSILYNLLEILVVLVPILLSVAFMTVIGRKVIGSMQRRIGPNVVGYYTLLQPFADALKLVIKEQVIPSQATKSLFFLALITVTLFYNVWFDPIYCQETEALATTATNRVASQSDLWNTRIITGACSAINVYSTYKIISLKCGIAGKVTGLTSIFAVSTSGATAMQGVTSLTPGSMYSRLNEAMSKGHNANIQVDGNKLSGSFNMSSSNSNSTNSNYHIHSPLEENWSFFDWLFSLLPNSVKQELRNRVPASDFSELSTIDVLHFQYNIVVLVIGVSVIVALYCLLLINIYRYSVKHRDSITEKFTLLRKIIPSDTAVKNLIIILQFFVVVNISTIFVGLNFLFNHPFVFN